jgi:hypothetical protein
MSNLRRTWPAKALSLIGWGMEQLELNPHPVKASRSRLQKGLKENFIATIRGQW